NKKLRLGLSMLLLAWLSWRTDWTQVVQAFAHLRLGWWLAAVGLYLVTQIVTALRWRLLARPLGLERPLRQFVACYFIGMFFSVFVDRFSGLLVLLALAGLAVALCPIALPAWVPVSVWGTVGAAVAALIGAWLLAGRSALAAKLPGTGRALGQIGNLRASGR